jgi:RNA polymerase sigma factor (sigma-70 family)
MPVGIEMVMRALSSKGLERRLRFTQRYLEQAPKVVLAMRNWMSTGGEEALDVIQDLYVKLIEQIDASKSALEFETLSDQRLRYYIAQAVRNRWIDSWRRQEIIKRNYSELARVLVDDLAAETSLVERERFEHLRRSVSALRGPYRELLQALLDEDVTLAELARRKKVKIGTIYSQFSRALERLRSEWSRKDGSLRTKIDPRK